MWPFKKDKNLITKKFDITDAIIGKIAIRLKELGAIESSSKEIELGLASVVQKTYSIDNESLEINFDNIEGIEISGESLIVNKFCENLI